MMIRDAGNWLLYPRRRLLGAAIRDPRSADHFLEAMLVLAIITILTGIAAERFSLLLNRIALLEAATLVHSQRPAAAEAIAMTGQLPAAIPDSRGRGGIEGRYFAGAEWRAGELAFAVRPEHVGRFQRHGVDGTAAGETLYLGFRFTQFSELSPLVILCGSSLPPAGAAASGPTRTNIAARHLPASCRS